jgi:hypothetical protein
VKLCFVVPNDIFREYKSTDISKPLRIATSQLESYGSLSPFSDEILNELESE